MVQELNPGLPSLIPKYGGAKMQQSGFKHKAVFIKLALLSVVSLLGFSSFFANATGGVSLGATRVIYNQDDKQSTISIENSNIKNRYLVQSWVEDLQGKKPLILLSHHR